MISEFPALIVVLPIFFSLIYLVGFRKKESSLFLMIFHLIAGYVLFSYYPHIAAKKIVKYTFGGWSAPFGIEFLINKVNYLFLCLMYLISFCVVIFTYGNLEKFVKVNLSDKFPAIYLILLAGFSGIILTNDLFNLYVFIEISAIATYSLASISNNRMAIKSSLDYLILGTFAATIILLGIGLIYADIGSLNMAHIEQILSARNGDDFVSKAGLFLIIIGLMMKFALFPFYSWLIKIYSHSSDFIVFFYSAISTKVMIITLFKLQLSFFGGNALFYISIENILLSLAIISIVFGSIKALQQNDLRKTLGYSSISQIGYMVLSVVMFPEDSYLLMALFISHAIAKMTLFMFSTTLVSDKKKENIQVTLFTLIIYVISAASIIGIPGTYGFTAKFLLLEKLFIEGNYSIITVMIVASIISILYFFKFFEIFYGNLNSNPNHSAIEITFNQKLIFSSLTLFLITLIVIGAKIKLFLG